MKRFVITIDTDNEHVASQLVDGLIRASLMVQEEPWAYSEMDVDETAELYDHPVVHLQRTE